PRGPPGHRLESGRGVPPAESLRGRRVPTTLPLPHGCDAASQRQRQGRSPPEGLDQAVSARYVLLHPAGWSPASVLEALAGAQIEARAISGPLALEVDERPTVFLLDAGSRSIFPLDAQRGFVDAGGAIIALGREGELDVPEPFATELLAAFVRHP